MNTPTFISQLRQSSRTLVRELDLLKGVFQDTGYTYSQCHALFELDRHGMMAAGELAEALRLDKSTTSRLLKSLVEKGLVKSEINGMDQRQKFFTLTPAGQEATRCNNALAEAQVEQALQLLDETEREAALQGLSLYAKALYQSRLQHDYTLRPVQPGDNKKVARIIRQVMTEFGTVGEGYSIMDPEVDGMYEAYRNPRSAFFVIERQGEVLGCGGIGPLAGGDEQTCELKKMYFLPELRGMGWGKRLALHCLGKARELGYRLCYLETVERMWQANKLYQRLGFKRLDAPLGSTGHSGCEAFYALPLS
ncbi:MAG: MarR family transcriptional regulator [Lewinellaceae bacterium]|nr:MarR family transcriptional regulator [Lewinellaceae bacterium]